MASNTIASENGSAKDLAPEISRAKSTVDRKVPLVNPDAMTVADMRKHLTKLGKSRVGSKVELAARIRESQEGGEKTVAEEGAQASTGEVNADDTKAPAAAAEGEEIKAVGEEGSKTSASELKADDEDAPAAAVEGEEEAAAANGKKAKTMEAADEAAPPALQTDSTTAAPEEPEVAVKASATEAEPAAEAPKGGGRGSTKSDKKAKGSGGVSDMTVAEMRTYLSKRGESREGNKQVLSDRIKALQDKEAKTDPTDATAAETDKTSKGAAAEGGEALKVVDAETKAEAPPGAEAEDAPTPAALALATAATPAAETTAAAAEGKTGSSTVAPSAVDPATMTVMAMRKHLSSLGLPTSGKKTDLEERIKQAQADGSAGASAGAKRKEPPVNEEDKADEEAEKKETAAAEDVKAEAAAEEEEPKAAEGGRAKRQRKAPAKAETTAKKEEEEEEKEKDKPKAEAQGSRKRGKAAKEKDAKEDKDAEDEPTTKKSKGQKAEAGATKDKEEEEKKEEEEEAADEKKAVVAKKVGKAVLDLHLPAHLKDKVHVVEQGGEVFDAVLNQTNTNANNNKFYVIQLLREGNSPATHLFCRWGRVGVPGQQSVSTYPTIQQGIAEFEAKFYDKTKNRWILRHDFKPVPGKYTMLEMDYSGEAEEEAEEKGKGKAEAAKKVQSKLDPRVLELINLICDADMMQREMMEIGYDAKKLPLGKLSRKTILQGYTVLKSIAAELDKASPSADTLSQLSSDFFTVIPHDFGFKKMREFIIRDKQTLKKKLEMVEALAEIEVATKVLKGSKEDEGKEPVHPADEQYERLHCQMEPLEDDSEEMKMVKTYLKNTHGATHSYYKLEVERAYRVKRDGEDERFQKLPNRQLLWHGSRLTNWTGILSQGLRIAPPEAPVTGYMFGKGVYFADMVSKSANYCYAGVPGTGLLLLCEVALGEPRELTNADYDAGNLPPGKHSTKGLGGTAPDPAGARTLEDGVLVPMGPGKPVDQKDNSYRSLLYNEYIVYSVDQIRMRYLLKCHFSR